jgi:hypothetical protein
MPETQDDPIERVIRELENLNRILELIVQGARRAPTPTPAPPLNLFLSGRWHRRDGNVYGNVAAQPMMTVSAETARQIEERVSRADYPPGHLRSPHKRGD